MNKLRYFLDTEFMEDGHTIELLSLGLVCDNGQEFYGINDKANLTKANLFVTEHVIPQLWDYTFEKPPQTSLVTGAPNNVAVGLMQFMSQTLPADTKPEFWGYYADYDWVVFCQLFGRMVDLPKGWPMYCNDIKQLANMKGDPDLPAQSKGEHHALLDARWNKRAHEFLIQLP